MAVNPLKAGVDALVKLVNEIGDPFELGEEAENDKCFFCGHEWDANLDRDAQHKEDCSWLRSVTFLEAFDKV
jgi:hypothetical protein